MVFTTDAILSALRGLMNNWYDDECSNYNETYMEDEDCLHHIEDDEGEEKTYDDAEEIPTKDLMSHNYKDLRVLQDGIKQLIEENKKLKEENKKLKEGTLLKFQEVEIADLQEENKKLKEGFEDMSHWQRTMTNFMDYSYRFSDSWCNFDAWFKENIDEDDKKYEWVEHWIEQMEYVVGDDEDDEQ